MVYAINVDSMSPMALVLVGQTNSGKTEAVALCGHPPEAGGRTEIFTDKTINEIYKESTGIPRRINRIYDSCLMYASQQGKHLTDERQVRFVPEHEILEGDVRCRIKDKKQKTQTRNNEIWRLLNDYANICDDVLSSASRRNRIYDAGHYRRIEQCELPFTNER